MERNEEVEAIVMVGPAADAPEAEVDAWIVEVMDVFEGIFGDIAGPDEPEVVPE